MYEAVLKVSRAPEFYGPERIPDSVDGRFELLALHLTLVNRRLQSLNPAFAQALFDVFKSDMEANLREMGTGDARFGKRMKLIVRALYGRMSAFETPLGQGDGDALAEAIQRNAPDGAGETYVSALAGYALSAASGLKDQPLDAFLAGRLVWPDPPATTAS